MDAPAAYRLITTFFRVVVGVFFRRVEISGADGIPEKGGGLLIAWHPNGLVDPGLIVTHFPRKVVFGARDGLFKVPLLGQIMRAIGTVPIQRAQDKQGVDPAARQAANKKTLDALAGAVAEGRFVCLFPEGTSHDLSRPAEVKTGAAHLWYQARRMAPDKPAPVIIPVGLHYDHKRAFRSEAHVVFNPPLALRPELDRVPVDDADQRELAKGLTAEIEQALHDVAHGTESWELHFLIRRTRKLMRAERAAQVGSNLGRPDIRERTRGFQRVWQGWKIRRAERPEEVAALEHRVREYDQDLRALGLEDHELDRSPRLASPFLGLLLLLQVVGVFLFLPPFVMLGYLVNLPVLLGIWGVTYGVAQKKKDEATLKVLIGTLALPITWLATGIAAWYLHGILDQWFPRLPDSGLWAALTIVGISIGGGWLALHYAQMVQETLRAVRVRLTRARRKQAIEFLRQERRALYQIVIDLAEGLVLPGEVDDLGRVVEAPDSAW